jgi:hypothetical protein
LDRSDDSLAGSASGVACIGAVLVLGMHRSGTSGLAGTLIRLGGGAPRHLMPPQPDNERGFWESDVLMALNDAILASGQSHWNDWRRFDPGWHKGRAAQDFHAEAIRSLASEYGNSPLPVIKDPRMCRLMPFWSAVLSEMGWPARVFLPVRSPLDVALSLQRRDGLSLNLGCLLWLRHVLESEAESRSLCRAVVGWDAFLRDWRAVIRRASQQVELAWPKSFDEARVDDFLSTGLRHHESCGEDLKLHPAVSDWAREAYASMLELAADPDSRPARAALDAIRADFEKAAAAFGTIFGELDKNCQQANAIAASHMQAAQEAAAECDRLVEKLASERRRAEEALAGERKLFAAQFAAQDTSFANLLAKGERERAQLRLEVESSAARLSEKQAEAAQMVLEKDQIIATANDLINAIVDRFEIVRRERWRMRLDEFVPFVRLRTSKLARGRGVVPAHYDAIRHSIFFDPAFYLDANPDVRAAGLDPVLHYLLHGGFEHRDPSSLFSTSGYLRRNVDVAEAGVNALLHYELYGRREGRKLL